MLCLLVAMLDGMVLRVENQKEEEEENALLNNEKRVLVLKCGTVL